MRRFYQSYQIQQAVSVKLSWSHYCELLTISDPDKRSFYEKGIEMSSPLDMIKDPYVFEFLGVPENKPMLESDLEKALVAQIEKFLLELKTTKLTPEAAGQLNMYLNYYAAEVNDEHDNPPIGIILCTDKDSIAAEYALGGLSNNIFASRYVSYIPDKEQLIAQVEAVLNEWHNSEKE